MEKLNLTEKDLIEELLVVIKEAFFVKAEKIDKGLYLKFADGQRFKLLVEKEK